MSRASDSTNYNDLLKKTEHYDKDERYMAISDLCEALKRNAAHANSTVDGAAASAGTASNAPSSSTYSPPKIDAQTERRICSAVMSLLDDSSNDVQTVAVKTLSVLLTTVQEQQVVEITDRLCSLVLDLSKSDLRDVYAIGLKTLVETVPSSMGNVVSHRLINRLIDGIHTNSSTKNASGASEAAAAGDDKSSEAIVLACLNVLADLLARFGSSSNSIATQHESLLNVALQCSTNRNATSRLRKRAGMTIGVLATVISDTLLHRLVERILDQIDQAEGIGRSGKKRARTAQIVESSSSTSTDIQSLIRTMCTVSGAVGHRLNQGHIDRIVPIFLRFCDPQDAVTGDDENYDSDEVMADTTDENAMAGLSADAAAAAQIELRESCFAGFESFVLRCPALIQPHMDQIILSSLAYMRYDPNYSYGDENKGDEDGDDVIDEDTEEVEEEEEEDEYSDEDDLSDEEDDENWKVRRGAIRSLTAVVEASKHNPSKLWIAEYSWIKNSNAKTTVAGALVNRFKERDENCRVDNIECFTRLLSYTVSAASSGVLVLASLNSMEEDSSAAGTVVVDLRSSVTAAIVKASEKQLGAKKCGERSKSSAIALLSVLCLAPGGVGGYDQIRSVFNHLQSIINVNDDIKQKHVSATSKSLKLEALCLVRVLLSRCNPLQHDAKHVKNALLPVLLQDICKCVDEDWYKVIAEALRVLMEVPHLMVLGSATKLEMANVAQLLYTAILPRLAEHDLDQEIKECALSASAALLSVLHASLSKEQKERIFELVLERLKNETTRLAAMKTLSKISDAAQSSHELDLSFIMNETLSQLALLLRQQSRGLKQLALQCLDSLVRCLRTDGDVDMDDGLFDSVLKELGDVIADNDLHVCHLSLSASNSVLRARPSTGARVKSLILPPALKLCNSPLLQDPALSSLLVLVKEMVTSKTANFEELRDLLVKQLDISNKSSKQVISNLAECIATIAAVATPSEQMSFMKSVITSIENSDGGNQSTQLYLLVSGNYGRKVDISSMSGIAENIQQIYKQSFDSSNEDIKHASALALGRATVGAVDAFLPGILAELEKSSGKKRYLLLSSLREFIHCFRDKEGGDLSSNIPVILPHLEKSCENDEEGVRSMVAECLGSLACLHPSIILPVLEKLTKKESPKKALVRWTVGNSVKFAIGNYISPTELIPSMPVFLGLLKEDDLAVKNIALLMVYSAVHHTPQLVAPHMKELILPQIEELAQLNMERKIDLGPFKHTVDDALPLRKAALSVFATCLEKCPSSLDITSFMPVIAKALADVEDVQLQAHNIVLAICCRYPSYVVAAADSFVAPLEKTVNKKKGNKTGTELERVHEWIKSGLRVMIAISKLDGAMTNRVFADFVDRINKSSPHRVFLQAVEEES